MDRPLKQCTVAAYAEGVRLYVWAVLLAAVFAAAGAALGATAGVVLAVTRKGV